MGNWNKYYRILIFLGVLLGTEYLYSTFFYESDLKQHLPLLLEFRSMEEGNDVLFLTQSSIYEKQDPSSQPGYLSEILGNHYPDLTVSEIIIENGELVLVNAILPTLDADLLPKTLILNLALHEFAWEKSLHSQYFAFKKNSRLIATPSAALNRMRFLLTRGHITERERMGMIHREWENDKIDIPAMPHYLCVKDWDRKMLLDGVKDEKGEYDHQQTALACHYIKQFGAPIDFRHHPLMKELDELIGHARKMDFELVINLVPQNVEDMQRLVGEDLITMLAHNRFVLSSKASENGIAFVDNSSLLGASDFLDRERVSTSISLKGKKQWVDFLATKIALLSDKK
jgi:hypothetical protein